MIKKELKKQLSELEKIKNLDEYKAKIRPFLTGLALDAKILKKGSSFYRTVPWIEFYTTVNRLSYPPKNKVKLGRCNREKNSVFYCSKSDKVSYPELKESIQVNQLLGIGRWICKDDVCIIPIGFTYEERKLLNLGNRQYSEKNQIIHNKIRKYFTNKGNKFYIQSAAISEIFMELKYPKERFKVEETILCYRSVENPSDEEIGLNFAMPTEFVDKHLELFESQVRRIDNCSNNKIDFTILKQSVNIEENQVKWRDSIIGWTLNKEQSFARVEVVKNGYKITDENGAELNPDFHTHSVKY